MSDTLGPTPEQLRKAVYEPPAKDRDTNRQAYRKVKVMPVYRDASAAIRAKKSKRQRPVRRTV